jgi:hypothetical protein
MCVVGEGVPQKGVQFLPVKNLTFVHEKFGKIHADLWQQKTPTNC